MIARLSRFRRWLALGAVVVLAIGGGLGWYFHRQHEIALADRAIGDIPTAEYEQWMQELGYTD